MNGWGRISRSAIALVVSAVLTLSTLPAAAFAAVRPPSVTVPSAMLMTMSGSRGWSRASSAPRRVASTIKMLNALVVRDRASLDETVTVSRKAAAINDGDVGLVTGQHLTVRQLLEIMLVASANDAAEALAIHIAGSERAYVTLMNAKARSLGLTHTHATDPHGLGKHETSTASDLSVLARRVMADPVLRAIVRKRSVSVPRPHGRARTVGTTDRLLGHYTGIEGVKTGFTNPAGYCFVGAAKRNGVELLGVVLGAKSVSARFSQMRTLLDWGFAHCHVRTLVSRDTTISVPLEGYSLITVTAHPEKTVSLALFDQGGAIVTTITPETTVTLPVQRGERLGTLKISRDGTALASVPLLADADTSPEALLPASTFGRLFAQH